MSHSFLGPCDAQHWSLTCQGLDSPLWQTSEYAYESSWTSLSGKVCVDCEGAVCGFGA